MTGSKGAKSGIPVELVKSADLIGAVNRSGAGTLWAEVRMIQYVEVLHAKLQLEPLSEIYVLGKLNVPI